MDRQTQNGKPTDVCRPQRVGDSEHVFVIRVRWRLRGTATARRGINEALDALFRESVALNGRAEFYESASETEHGLTLLDLMYFRGKSTHTLVEGHEEGSLFPREDAYPSADFYPTVNYWWMKWPEFEPLILPREKEPYDRRAEVMQYRAGRLVVQGLRRSVDHLRWSLENLVKLQARAVAVGQDTLGGGEPR